MAVLIENHKGRAGERAGQSWVGGSARATGLCGVHGPCCHPGGRATSRSLVLRTHQKGTQVNKTVLALCAAPPGVPGDQEGRQSWQHAWPGQERPAVREHCASGGSCRAGGVAVGTPSGAVGFLARGAPGAARHQPPWVQAEGGTGL